MQIIPLHVRMYVDISTIVHVCVCVVQSKGDLCMYTCKYIMYMYIYIYTRWRNYACKLQGNLIYRIALGLQSHHLQIQILVDKFQKPSEKL